MDMARKLPNLNQLRAFEAAARHQSFKNAADELFVTHAAVSHQIKALEQALGVQLFHRRTREVVLTAEGKKYADGVSRALDDLAEATRTLAADRMTGTVTITAAPFFTNRLVLPRLARFKALYPDIDILLSFEDALVDLQNARVDAGIRYGEGGWPGLTSILLHNDNVGPVASPAYLKGRKVPLDPAEIAQMTLAYVAGRQQDWTDWFRDAGLSEIPRLMTVEYQTRARTLDLALSGNGVALADIQLTRSDEASGQLLRLHPLTIRRKRGIYLVFAQTAIPDPRVQAFAEWMRQEVGDLAQVPAFDG